MAKEDGGKVTERTKRDDGEHAAAAAGDRGRGRGEGGGGRVPRGYAVAGCIY